MPLVHIFLSCYYPKLRTEIHEIHEDIRKHLFIGPLELHCYYLQAFLFYDN